MGKGTWCMRIDKLLSDMGILSRKDTARAVRRGEITVDGEAVTSSSIHIDPQRQCVAYRGQAVAYRRFTYILLNKPAGYVSATDDPHLPYVTELLPEDLRRLDLFPVGRLDRDTTGVMLLTNNGPLAHELLSPRHHVEKVYRFTCEKPLSATCEALFRRGVSIGDYICKPAELTADEDRMGGLLLLTEGKYHQVKRMLEAVDNRVLTLERVRFGTICADATLPRGGFRLLTAEEIRSLAENAKSQV